MQGTAHTCLDSQSSQICFQNDGCKRFENTTHSLSGGSVEAFFRLVVSLAA